MSKSLKLSNITEEQRVFSKDILFPVCYN